MSRTSTPPSPLASLAAFCDEHELPWDEARRTTFREYLELLEKFNESMNLIGSLRRDEIVADLLIDSLTPAAVEAPSGRMLDVGTGAGLPGIPLKIAHPSIELTLVEPRRKRSTFLRIATNRLDLEGVEILRERIEDVERTPFDYVISKAFRPPDDWLPIASDFAEPGTRIVCMASEEDRELATRSARSEGLNLLASVQTQRDLGVERQTSAGRVVLLFESNDEGTA